MVVALTLIRPKTRECNVMKRWLLLPRENET